MKMKNYNKYSFLKMPLYEADLDKLAVEVKSVSKKRVTKKDGEPKKRAHAKEKESDPKKRVRVSKKKTSEKSDDVKTLVDEPAAPTVEPTPEIKIEPTPEPEIKPVAEIKPEPVAETKLEEKPVKEKKPRAPRQKKDPAIAPLWFAKYVEGVKKEQAAMKSEKVPAKKVKEEAKEAAAKSWNHGLTRNRVQNEVDSHMSRMYSMIFSK